MNEPQPRPAEAEFKRLLRQALAEQVPTGEDAAAAARILARVAGRVQVVPHAVVDHRRDLLFGLSASALAAGTDDDTRPSPDLSALVRERLRAAFALGRKAGWVMPRRELTDWVSRELLFELPLSPEEWRRVMLAVAEGLAEAERDGEIMSGDGPAVRLVPAPAAGPVVETAAGQSTTRPPAVSDAAERRVPVVELLRRHPDQRVAEWYLIRTCCDRTVEELAAAYDVAPGVIDRTLARATAYVRSAANRLAPVPAH